MDDSKKTKSKKRISLTPEEKIARAFRAKCRFKAMVRFVMQNLYWLTDIEEEELGDNVQKNVFLITRKKSMKGLSLQDKYVLNKPTEYRTEIDKLRLDRAIGGLKCFRRYPANVKSQLAGITYFFYYEPGRTVVRQGHQSDALYFIITGFVDVFQESVDPVLKESVTVSLGTKGPGSMFGEVALLHDIPRTATVITNTHCELLCLKKRDFETVLKSTVKREWDQTQTAMKLFSYFQNWNEISIRECCILSKINAYATNQTILGDGEGLLDYVYFILKGQCQVIEHLLVTTYVINGKKCFKLFVEEPTESVSTLVKSSVSYTIKRAEGGSTSGLTIKSPHHVGKTSNTETKEVHETSSKCRTDRSSNSRSLSSVLHKLGKSSVAETTSTSEHGKSRTISKGPTTPSLRTENKPTTNLPTNVKTYFVQVCFLNPMACFGIGENMNNRRIVALIPTQCLLIPRYWLMQRNIGNVWHKVLHFLNNHIPTTKQVFKEFVKQRKWMAFRKQTFHEFLKRKLPNINSLTNVPYSIRMHEEINFE